ncbi:MAG: DUF4213 domain-containing protein [Syntrophomonadaceae bacterium]|nr:DUF4213 domain-containing protein [Syntrophomonadaceae bacterium]
MWKTYDELIDLIPDDSYVIDYIIGLHWTRVHSEMGIGAAMILKGGKIKVFKQGGQLFCIRR